MQGCLVDTCEAFEGDWSVWTATQASPDYGKHGVCQFCMPLTFTVIMSFSLPLVAAYVKYLITFCISGSFQL